MNAFFRYYLRRLFGYKKPRPKNVYIGTANADILLEGNSEPTRFYWNLYLINGKRVVHAPELWRSSKQVRYVQNECDIWMNGGPLPDQRFFNAHTSKIPESPKVVIRKTGNVLKLPLRDES